MAEDLGLCTYEKHHKQKIVLFLSAMRAYADELREAGYDVHYQQLDISDSRPFEIKLAAAMKAAGSTRLQHFEIEDKAMEERLVRFAESKEIDRTELRSPMFVCSREDFAAHVEGRPRASMAEFYKWQRRRLGVLVGDDGSPLGGRWSFDQDNRKKLPAAVTPPAIRWPEPDVHVPPVIDLVDTAFPGHPGAAREFRWPTTRRQARAWLDDFIRERLAAFGPYEDAMTSRSDTLFHSLLSPYLNMGLLTPDEVIDRVTALADEVPVQSVEGFVRQVIGWREFIRGVYREFGDDQEASNFWGHQRELTDAWYEGSTGLPPLDETIRTVQRLGWTHHIPRLMILGNLMTLCEIRPRSAHRWFMEMFVDSSEWVMGPNVYGMALFSDGGVFATKPYICGSNYLRKMGDFATGGWCEIVDGLYWRFIERHREFFSRNPRLALMPNALDRIPDDRRALIFAAADEFIAEHTR
jgi:deoxyribodipyrimidine photolyase-related protein